MHCTRADTDALLFIPKLIDCHFTILTRMQRGAPPLPCTFPAGACSGDLSQIEDYKAASSRSLELLQEVLGSASPPFSRERNKFAPEVARLALRKKTCNFKFVEDSRQIVQKRPSPGCTNTTNFHLQHTFTALPSQAHMQA